MILLIALTTAACWLVVSGLRVDFSTEVLFESHDARVQRYNAFIDQFGDDDTSCYLLVELSDPLAPPSLVRIDQWCKHLETLPFVESVYAPTQPLGTALPFIDPQAISPQRVAQLRRFLHSPSFERLLIDAPEELIGIVIQTRNRHPSDPPLKLLTHALWQFVGQLEQQGFRAHLTGIPILEQEYVLQIETDIARFLPLMLLQCLVLLLLLFRTWRVIFALLVIAGSVIWAAAVLVLANVPIDITNHIITVLVLVVGTSDAIHLMARFEQEFARGLALRAAIDATLDQVGVACLLTTTTTGMGFFSLILIDNPALKQLAIYAPLAMLATFILCVTAIPLALLLSGGLSGVHSTPRQDSAALACLARLIMRHHWLILVLCGMTAVAAAFGCAAVETRSNWLAMLTSDNRVQCSNDTFEHRMAGIVPIELLIDHHDRANPFSRGSELEALLELHRALAGDPTLPARKVISVAGMIADLNAHGELLLAVVPRSVITGSAITPDASWLIELMAPLARIPPQAGLVSALLTTNEHLAGDRGRLLSRYLDKQRRTARITLLCRDSSPEQIYAAVKRIEQHFQQSALAKHADLTVTGTGLIVALSIERLTNDMMLSLVFVFAMVLATIGILLRSMTLCALSLPPNVLPIVVALGAMPLLDMQLNFSVAVIFTIGVGIAVDDTIHLLVRYVEERRQCGQRSALAAAIRGAGRAIIFTTVLLVCGFLTLYISRFKTAHTFATLGLLISVAALIGDLLLLPALLLVSGVERDPDAASPDVCT
jgi:predicted RND superfamily exporter protein